MIKNIQITEKNIKEDIRIQEELLIAIKDKDLKVLPSILEGKINSLKKLLNLYEKGEILNGI